MMKKTENNQLTYDGFNEVMDDLLTPKLEGIIQDAMDYLDKEMKHLNIGERTLVATQLSKMMVGTTLGQLLKDHRYLVDESVEALCEDITGTVEEMFEFVDTHMPA